MKMWQGQKSGTRGEWNLLVLYNKDLNFVRIKAALFHVRRAKLGPLGPSQL